MNSVAWVAVGVAVSFVVLLRLVPVITLFFQLRRIDLTPPGIANERELDDEPSAWGEVWTALSEDRQAAVQELRELGFVALRAFQVQIREESWPLILMRHAQLPAYAEVLLMPGTGAGYPVSFTTVDEQEILHVTVNRRHWFLNYQPLGWKISDALANSVEAQWAFHQQAMQAIRAAPRDDQALLKQWHAELNGRLDALAAAGYCSATGAGHYLNFAATLQALRRWWRLRRVLMAPFASAATRPEHALSYSVQLFEAMERARQRMGQVERDRWPLLLGTLLLSLAAWSIWFDWHFGLVLIGVLLLHEAGHALAMRAFGYRDVSMFFVPLLGAMVTGVPQAPIAAWKRAVILLAGPVPGAVLGFVMLRSGWALPTGAFGGIEANRIAMLLLIINLLNLLPFTPLDGGRLLELAVFDRWPMARLGLWGISLICLFGFGLSAGDGVLMGFAVALLLYFRSQWALTRLHRQWRADLPQREAVQELIKAAPRIFPNKTFIQQIPWIRLVVQQHQVRPARLWERGLILAGLLGLWGVIAVPLISAYWLTQSSDVIALDRAENQSVEADERTSLQSQFDVTR